MFSLYCCKWYGQILDHGLWWKKLDYLWAHDQDSGSLRCFRKKQRVACYNIKRQFFFFGSSVLEYDAEGFMKLSLLFKVQGFFCIVHSKCCFWYKYKIEIKRHIFHFDTKKWDILNRNQPSTYNGNWPKGAFWLSDVWSEWGLNIITTRFIFLFSWIRQELSPRSATILPPVDLPRKK